MFDISSILITGAQGQLGRAFQKVMPEAMLTSRFELDFSWKEEKLVSALQDLRPCAIIHTAAYTNVDGAESEQGTALHVNGTATGILVEYCRRNNIPIVYYSTDYVFHSGSDRRTEEEVPNPQSVYGISKYIGELHVKTYEKGTVIRISSVFGDGKNFPRTMLKLSESLKEISVVCDQIMRPTYAPDAAQATFQLLKRYWMNGEWKVPSLIHMQNSGPGVTWADFARHLFSAMGKRIRIREITFDEYVRSHAGKHIAPRPAYSLFDLTVLDSLHTPLRNWVDALHEFCQSFKSPQQ